MGIQVSQGWATKILILNIEILRLPEIIDFRQICKKEESNRVQIDEIEVRIQEKNHMMKLLKPQRVMELRWAWKSPKVEAKNEQVGTARAALKAVKVPKAKKEFLRTARHVNQAQVKYKLNFF
jgi:hypothetical protein